MTTVNTNSSYYRVTISSAGLPTETAGTVTALAAYTNTGNGTCNAVVVDAAALSGMYTIVFTSATHFLVTAPNGIVSASQTNGTPYTTGITFTMTAGGTAFVAGDTFTVVVGQGSNPSTLPLYSSTAGATSIGDNGFIDNMTVPQYEVVTGSFPSNLVNSLAKSRANMRYRQIINSIQTMSNCYTTEEVTETVGTVTAGANTGNGTSSVATANYTAIAGTYTVTFTTATAYTVTDPNGNLVGTGTTGTLFNNQIALTIDAGGTAFVAGDSFTIATTAITQDTSPTNFSFTVYFFDNAAVQTKDETVTTSTVTLTSANAVQRCIARALSSNYTQMVEYYDPTVTLAGGGTAGYTGTSVARYGIHRDYITAGNVASSLSNATAAVTVTLLPNMFWV